MRTEDQHWADGFPPKLINSVIFRELGFGVMELKWKIHLVFFFLVLQKRPHNKQIFLFYLRKDKSEGKLTTSFSISGKPGTHSLICNLDPFLIIFACVSSVPHFVPQWGGWGGRRRQVVKKMWFVFLLNVGGWDCKCHSSLWDWLWESLGVKCLSLLWLLYFHLQNKLSFTQSQGH